MESPYRNRPVEENLDLFQRMNAGEFEEGSMVLRAKIDMSSSNMHFRDPIMYRIIKHPHHRSRRTGSGYRKKNVLFSYQAADNRLAFFGNFRAAVEQCAVKVGDIQCFFHTAAKLQKIPMTDSMPHRRTNRIQSCGTLSNRRSI